MSEDIIQRLEFERFNQKYSEKNRRRETCVNEEHPFSIKYIKRNSDGDITSNRYCGICDLDYLSM